MSAGIPGLGLGGVFFVLSALLSPVVELYRTTRGRSSTAAWRRVGRQFAIATVMVIAVECALRLLLLAGSLLGAGPGPASAGLSAVPVAPVGVTVGLLGLVIVAAKGLQLVVRFGGRRRETRIGRRTALCPQPCSCCPQARG
jgi:hypothetical protein